MLPVRPMARVIATLGDTQVMAAVTFAKHPKPGQDFFPLTVHYQEKYYAAGKIPGGFFKREARPSEKETLISRLIDRPCRPLFVEGFKHEVLVMATVLSCDLVNDPDVVAMIATSAALTISGVPFMGPIAAARVGFANGAYVLNPDMDDMTQLRMKPDQRLDLVVAGTKDAVMMVESEAYELTEEEMLGAVVFGHEQMQPVIDLIIDFAEVAAKEPFDFSPARLFGAVCKGQEGWRKGRCAPPSPSATSKSAPLRSRRRCRDQGRDVGRRSGRCQPRLGDQEAGIQHPAR